MPRRYYAYPDEFQVLNVLSSAGASILGIGYLLPFIYLIYSLVQGQARAGESVGREGPRVDDLVAAADVQLRRGPDRDRAGVRLQAAAGGARWLDAHRTHSWRRIRHGAHAHHPKQQHHFYSMEQQLEASILGMWVFLVTEVMFFGGLFMAYIVYRHMYPLAWAESSHELNVYLGGANTVVLICSRLTMALAVRAAQVGSRTGQIVNLILTILFGTTFLVVKYFEYAAKFEHHLVPGPALRSARAAGQRHARADPPAARLGDLLLALLHHDGHPRRPHGRRHRLMLVILVMAWKGKFAPDYYSPVEVSGLYWHFVDIVWIFLFPLLYLLGVPLRLSEAVACLVTHPITPVRTYVAIFLTLLVFTALTVFAAIQDFGALNTPVALGDRRHQGVARRHRSSWACATTRRSRRSSSIVRLPLAVDPVRARDERLPDPGLDRRAGTLNPANLLNSSNSSNLPVY